MLYLIDGFYSRKFEGALTLVATWSAAAEISQSKQGSPMPPTIDRND
jgi:hypothetical protein